MTPSDTATQELADAIATAAGDRLPPDTVAMLADSFDTDRYRDANGAIDPAKVARLVDAFARPITAPANLTSRRRRHPRLGEHRRVDLGQGRRDPDDVHANDEDADDGEDELA